MTNKLFKLLHVKRLANSKYFKFLTCNYSKFIKKSIAFTLAETLIVMGVIGVVAALTLPNLNQSTSNKEKVSKIKKIYKELNDAYGRAEAVYGPLPTWFNNDSSSNVDDIRVFSKRAGSRLVEFLKVRKDCGVEESGCMKQSWYIYRDGSLGDGQFGDAESNYYRFILQDGTSIALAIWANNTGGRCSVHEDQELYNVGLCGWLWIDLGGPNKGKHMWGSEVFDFYITTEGFLPIGTPLDKYGNSNSRLQENCIIKGYRCAGWVIQNGNMDYLKTNSNGVCPNGVVLSWDNTTCN